VDLDLVDRALEPAARRAADPQRAPSAPAACPAARDAAAVDVEAQPAAVVRRGEMRPAAEPAPHADTRGAAGARARAPRRAAHQQRAPAGGHDGAPAAAPRGLDPGRDRDRPAEPAHAPCDDAVALAVEAQRRAEAAAAHALRAREPRAVAGPARVGGRATARLVERVGGDQAGRLGGRGGGHAQGDGRGEQEQV
jgi:hypothetical protein